MPIKTYDPTLVFGTFRGELIAGFAEETMISVERNEDSFALTVGSQGEGARTKSANRSGKIKFSLLQTSQSNDVLSNAMHADEIFGGRPAPATGPAGIDGVGPFLLKDASGTTLVTAQNAWIKKPPAVEFGSKIVNRDWELESDNINFVVVGGN